MASNIPQGMLLKREPTPLTPEDIAESVATEHVNHPTHYMSGGIEVIDVIEAYNLGFNLGNVVKYILRAGHKGDRKEDLRKAAWYLQREIERS